MKIFILVLFSLMISQSSTWGQSAIVKGSVQDSTLRTPVEGADVFLFTKEGRKPLLHMRTDSTGFRFLQVPNGTFRVVITAPGYNNDTLHLVIDNNEQLTVTSLLKQVSNNLDGVVVKSTPKPITVKGDTVVFHADAFAVRPNAQLEDLLRKLPGVDVDKDGNITMQGQKIDKITVNGKDFFLGNIKQANSLPAEMISSIEAFGTQSERAKFSGVKENNPNRTLNIKTKKGMDQAVFGNAYASKGQGNSYATGGLFTKFGGERMLMGGLRVNNINNRFLGVESKNLGAQNGIQSTASFNVNYREKWGKKITAALSFDNSGQKLDVLQSTNRRTFFSDSSLQENRLSKSVNKTSSYPVNLSLTYDVDSMNQLQLNSSINISNNTSINQDTAAIQTLLNNNSNYLSSRTQTDNSTRQNSFNVNNQLDWRHRFGKPGRSLQIGFSQSSQTSNSPGSLYSILNGFDQSGKLLQQTVTNQRYTQSSQGKGYGGSLMYTEPLAKDHNLSFSYNFNTDIQQSDRRSNDFDSITGEYSKPNTLTTNNFDNRNTSHKLEGSYGMSRKDMSYQLGLGWQYSILDNQNLSPNRQIKQHFTNIFPRAMVNFNLGKGKNLSVNYNGSSYAPSLEQLQPLPDLSNPLLVKTGNPDLKQSFNHSVNASLNSYSMKTYRGIMLSVQGDMVQNQIVSSSMLQSGGVQELKYMNVNGTYHVGSMASYSFGLGKAKEAKNSGSISSRVRYGHDIGMINGAENVTNSLSWGQTVKLNYSIGTKFISEFLGGIDYSDYRYSVSPAQNTRSWSQHTALNVSYELPWGINIQSSYSWMHQGTSGLLPSQSSGVLNAAIFKRLFEKQQWQVRLSGFDLLNTNRNYNQTAASNYVYTQQTNQLQRMLLLSLVYDFRLYPGLKKGEKSPYSMPYSPYGMRSEIM